MFFQNIHKIKGEGKSLEIRTSILAKYHQQEIKNQIQIRDEKKTISYQKQHLLYH